MESGMVNEQCWDSHMGTQENFKKVVQSRVLKYYQDVALDDAGNVRKGVLEALHEKLELHGVGRDKANISRALRGEGLVFADQFQEPKRQIVLTWFFGLGSNVKYLQECAELGLPAGCPKRLQLLSELMEKAHEGVTAYAQGQARPWREFDRQRLFDLMEVAAIELLFCYHHKALTVEEATAATERTFQQILGTEGSEL